MLVSLIRVPGDAGTFLSTCMACSLGVALTYFHALLAIFGPADPSSNAIKLNCVLGKVKRVLPTQRSRVDAAAIWSPDDE